MPWFVTVLIYCHTCRINSKTSFLCNQLWKHVWYYALDIFIVFMLWALILRKLALIKTINYFRNKILGLKWPDDRRWSAFKAKNSSFSVSISNILIFQYKILPGISRFQGSIFSGRFYEVASWDTGLLGYIACVG